MLFQTVAICSVIFSLIHSCQAIVLRDVGVPAYAPKGSKAVLSCDYDLQHQELYAVKWYRNGEEFYRYVPANPNPMTVYARLGVHVDKQKSDARKITLENIDLNTMGRYRCEVSTEGPSFATVSNYGDMIVVVVPSASPIIQGGKPRYRVGDIVDVNCTSPDSKPAADLIWYINGDKADPAYIIDYPIRNTSQDLHTATKGLHFKVEESDFSSTGNLKLKCVAKIDTYYWKSNEKSAQGLKHRRRASFNNDDKLAKPPNSARGLSSSLGFNKASRCQQYRNSLLLCLILTTWMSMFIPI